MTRLFELSVGANPAGVATVSISKRLGCVCVVATCTAKLYSQSKSSGIYVPCGDDECAEIQLASLLLDQYTS